jgi:hypothetical protein
MASSASKTPASITESCQRFFVAGISRSITSDDLRTHFSRFGSVLESRVQRDATGLSLGYGWIGFDKPCPSLLDIEHRINGQVLDVQVPRSRQQVVGAPPPPAVVPNKDTTARPLVPPSQSHAIPSAQHERIDRKRSRSRSRARDQRRSRSHERDRGARGDRHEDRAADRSDRRPPPPPGPPPAVPQDILRTAPVSYPAHQVAAPVRQPPPPAQPPLGSFSESEYFVCIPSSLCPPQYMRDPRVLFVTMDPNGTFRQMQLPLGNAPSFTQPHLPPQNFPARSYPPPPPAATSSHPSLRYY